jgi:hypothetical protein
MEFLIIVCILILNPAARNHLLPFGFAQTKFRLRRLMNSYSGKALFQRFLTFAPHVTF